MNINMTNCVRCGSANISGAQFCSGCGAAASQALPQGSNSRAIIALVLGIVGLIACGLTAIPGVILAWLEMDAVKTGKSPQANAKMAKAAFWINIAALVFTLFCLGFGLLGSMFRY